ncbi:hypothetical protein SO802_007224 [Lithocarpus litseifolius]|uniref:HAT C-terminal dimerisation domain-containing protein n=1 Tax=Lithocarpus litseifolius TaxID=425828 RepID=A0AAW2DNW5_9ROSI
MSLGYGDEMADEMVELVRKIMDRVYDDYSRVNSRYEHFLEAEKSIGCSNEIEKYLAENCESRRDVKFEILGWWKANSDRYQALSKMARDVLTIPVSMVASE